MINCREEFEDWLFKVLDPIRNTSGIFDTNQHSCYKHKFVHDAWVSWKAAWDRLTELSND